MTKHARFFLLPSFILISAALIAGCNDKGEEKAHVGEPQVTVHIVKTAPLEVKTELPGRTNAYRIAEVRPQVSGIVLSRNFTEGSDVQAGQSLYQIDPATYQASYDSAKGVVRERTQRGGVNTGRPNNDEIRFTYSVNSLTRCGYIRR